APQRVLAVSATPAAIVFGWYGWQGEGRVVCVDAQSLRIRWQRRIAWPDDERELSPGVFAVVRDDAIFILLSGKRGENLFRLRPGTGQTVWSQKIERFILGVPLVWHDGHLLVQSRITQHYPNGHGHYQAIDPETGATIWRLRFDGTAGFWDDAPLIVGERTYLTSEISPGPSNHLYAIDIAAGRIVTHRIVEALREPFALQDGIMYFGTATPSAWDVKNDGIVWRSRLTRPYSSGPSIVPGPVLAQDVERLLRYASPFDDASANRHRPATADTGLDCASGTRRACNAASPDARLRPSPAQRPLSRAHLSCRPEEPRGTLPPTLTYVSADGGLRMPFVNITIYEGHPKERKDEIARRVTDTITDVRKLPREAAWVVFNEVTPPDWYVAGNPGKK